MVNKRTYDFVNTLRKEKRASTRSKYFRLSIAIFCVWFIGCLPEQLFNDSTSTVLLDRNGNLLGARIADDGQWRFEESDSVPSKFATCIIQFEDRQFYQHSGVSVKGIARAIVQNSTKGKRVSGGSTITMQVIRMMQKNPPRTYSRKILEIFLATRLEWSYSKNEILVLYASHAPFGNNVVGLEAASWRYYGRPSYQLSWAESATLAVLPNAPGLIYPGKNHELLMTKRNRLLKRLHDEKIINSVTYHLSLTEPLPGKPLPLPYYTQHLLDKVIKEGKKGQTIQSTISLNLQQKTKRLLDLHSKVLQDNKIYNGAVIITSVKTGEVMAYIGNTDVKDEEYSSFVDCANAPRSSGSILKPILYAAAMDEGMITPSMLVTDVPSQFGSFSPKNFSGQFEGAIPINKALSRSLNIPMVHLLNDYGVKKFHKDLQGLGITTMNKPSRHYGLTLILGGAETKLTELSKMYTQLAQVLTYGKNKGFHFSLDNQQKVMPIGSKWSKAAIYNTFEAMVEVNRPDEDNNWRLFNSSQKIAWKTGTSFGFRDAWAIGITPDYVVSVWIGNADGEGRPGLTGVNSAAPLLFDIFRQLPKSGKWFQQPINDMNAVELCGESGYKAGKYCEIRKAELVPNSRQSVRSCPFHQLIHLDKSGTYRVDSDCENVYDMQQRKWFVLPSLMERYYKLNHPKYKVLPEYKATCLSGSKDQSFTIVYPKRNSKIYVPIELDGAKGRSIFEASHRHNGTRVFWHLDKTYVGETMEIHQISLNPNPGKHVLTVIDEHGVSQTVRFEVIGK